MGGPVLDRVERRHRPFEATVGRRRRDRADNGVLHTVQRQHPATGSVWRGGWPRRIRTERSSLGDWRVRSKPHQHGLHYGDLRDGTHGVRRTSRRFASVRHGFHAATVGHIPLHSDRLFAGLRDFGAPPHPTWPPAAFQALPLRRRVVTRSAREAYRRSPFRTGWYATC